jgi:hypothetical protein
MLIRREQKNKEYFYIYFITSKNRQLIKIISKHILKYFSYKIKLLAIIYTLFMIYLVRIERKFECVRVCI